MIYTYRCTSCQHTFEKMLSMARMEEPEGEPCPACVALEVKQIISGASTYAFMAPDQLGRNKPPRDWTDWLGNLKKKNPGAADFNTHR